MFNGQRGGGSPSENFRISNILKSMQLNCNLSVDYTKTLLENKEI